MKWWVYLSFQRNWNYCCSPSGLVCAKTLLVPFNNFHWNTCIFELTEKVYSVRIDLWKRKRLICFHFFFLLSLLCLLLWEIEIILFITMFVKFNKEKWYKLNLVFFGIWYTIKYLDFLHYIFIFCISEDVRESERWTSWCSEIKKNNNEVSKTMTSLSLYQKMREFFLETSDEKQIGEHIVWNDEKLY